MNDHAEIRSRWLGNPRILLAALVLQILLTPLARTTDLPLAHLLASLTLLAAIDMACAERRDFRIGLALGLPALALGWIGDGEVSALVGQAGYLLTVVLFVFILSRMLQRVFRAPTVGADTIYLAICCYLLIGATWTFFYQVLAHLDPGAFTSSTGLAGGALRAELFYFSYVTLTTLGYGDISPVTPLARSAAVLEAVTGTLFLAVLIAMLMGKYTSRKDESGPA